MSASIRPIEYFTATVHGAPERAYALLGHLAGAGVNLLAFNAIPVGLQATQLVLFPEEPGPLTHLAHEQRLDLAGPDRAFLISGDDELGLLARVHEKLAAAGVHPYASTGVTDGRGGFGYIVYVRKEQFEAAARALKV
jgi:hypothetical protein